MEEEINMMSILLMLHMCKDKGMHFSLPNYKKEAWQYPNSQTNMVIQTLNVFYRRQTFIPQKKIKEIHPSSVSSAWGEAHFES